MVEGNDLGSKIESLSGKSKRLITIGASVCVFIIVATIIVFQMISWNEADERLVHQSAFTGTLTVINDAGPYLRAFGSVEPYKKVI